MVTLRPLDLGDAPAVVAAVHASRDALRRWMVWYYDGYCLDDAEGWIRQSLAAREAETSFHFTIRGPDDALVGLLGLEDVTEATGRAMLGYWVTTPATGRGVGTRAVELALVWVREHSDIRVVWALVADTNERSRRVVEANGFRVVEAREPDERGDVPLVYELDLHAR